jgi:hypothetical protein
MDYKSIRAVRALSLTNGTLLSIPDNMEAEGTEKGLGLVQ